MEPASSIIEKLGGPKVVSEGIGVSYTAPYRWTYPRERGGTCGCVPYRHIPHLLRLAAKLGVDLSAADFQPKGAEAATPQPAGALSPEMV